VPSTLLIMVSESCLLASTELLSIQFSSLQVLVLIMAICSTNPSVRGYPQIGSRP
jgi:hypothetical protein